MAKKGNSRGNKRSSTPARRPSSVQRPSPRAWIFAIALVVIFAGGVGFFDSHRSNNPTALIHKILQHTHPTSESGKPPEFDFYTALPSGKLTMVPGASTGEPTPAVAPTTNQKTLVAPSTTATKPTTSAASTSYFLQVASFPQYADADRLKAQLLLDDFNANTEKSVINGKEWYRVVVGPYGDLKSLNQAQNQLTTLHYQAIKLQTQ